MSKNSRTSYGLGLGGPTPSLSPQPIIARRDPVGGDLGYEIGTIWINELTNQSWILTSVAAGVANFTLASPGASDVDTVNGLSPVLGNIIIDGGTNITDVNAGNTVTLNLDAAITLATSVTAPLFTASAADAVLQAGGANDVVVRLGDNAGATYFRVQDSDSADVYTIDSDGTLAVMLGLTVTGALTQTAGAVNISMDNAANAVNIAGGTAARAVTILSGAAAHTLAVGSASAGAITVDTAAGISLDGATASNLTVTGASEDLTLASVGGSVNIDGSEADAAAVSIQASDAAGGIDMDCGSGGLDILATAGAFSIDAQLASNITVTAAGEDLSIQGVGGAVNITSTQGENDAVYIEASAANGGVEINAGTGGVRIGDEADCTGLTFGNIAPTANRNITIGSGTVVTASVTDDISIGDGGATTNADSIKSVDINNGGVAVGQVLTYIASGAVTSGTHTTDIAAGNVAAGTAALNLSTGTGTKTVNVGNADAATTMNLDGDVVINTNVNGSLSACVGTSTGTVTLGNIANSGAMSLESSSTVDVDAAGAISINSTAAAINIGDDDIDQAVNVGTDGERTVTVGSTNGAAATVIQSGTAGTQIAAGIGGIDLQSGLIVEYTAINTAAHSPYSVLGTDYYIGTNSTGGALAITLPAAPEVGRTYVIYDAVGQAAIGGNVTITGNAGNITAAGASAATFVINTAYESISLTWNGTTWMGRNAV